MKKVDLDLTRGDTGRWNLVFNPSDALSGTPKIWFTVKKAHSDSDGAAVAVLTSDLNGGITIDSIGGTAEVVLLPTATSSLVTPSPPAPLSLVYDIQLKQDDGTITTVLSGNLNITSDITRATT